MSSFNDIIKINAGYSKNTIDGISDGLANEDFQPLLELLPSVLERIYGNTVHTPRKLIDAIDNIWQYPKSEWYLFFSFFMAKVIGRMESGQTAFFDKDDFPWVKKIEAQYGNVLAEFADVSSNVTRLPAFQEFHDVQYRLTDDNKWKVLAFQAYGRMFEGNLKLLPETAKILNLIPGWTTGMFSILMPGKHIPPHDGPYKGVLRYHLGLTIPEGCGINVKGETRHWKAGSSLIFDDTFEHFAWNDSPHQRAVLFVDFLRPLPFPLNIFNEWIVRKVFNQSEFIQKNIDETSFHEFQRTFTKVSL